jgi:hypothetical protein
MEALLDDESNWPYDFAIQLSRVALECCNHRTKQRPQLFEVYIELEQMRREFCEIWNQHRENKIVSSLDAIGICYGMNGDNLPPPTDVAAMYNTMKPYATVQTQCHGPGSS